MSPPNASRALKDCQKTVPSAPSDPRKWGDSEPKLLLLGCLLARCLLGCLLGCLLRSLLGCLLCSLFYGLFGGLLLRSFLLCGLFDGFLDSFFSGLLLCGRLFSDLASFFCSHDFFLPARMGGRIRTHPP